MSPDGPAMAPGRGVASCPWCVPVSRARPGRGWLGSRLGLEEQRATGPGTPGLEDEVGVTQGPGISFPVTRLCPRIPVPWFQALPPRLIPSHSFIGLRRALSCFPPGNREAECKVLSLTEPQEGEDLLKDSNQSRSPEEVAGGGRHTVEGHPIGATMSSFVEGFLSTLLVVQHTGPDPWPWFSSCVHPCLLA